MLREGAWFLAKSVIVAGARTPIGKLSGTLAGFRAAELAGLTIAEAVGVPLSQRTKLTRCCSAKPSRLVKGKIRPDRRRLRVASRMACRRRLSTRSAFPVCTRYIWQHLMIQTGEAEVVIAGGMESMTNAPYILEGARRGYRYGDSEVFDSIQADGLKCAFERVGMGVATEGYAEKAGISREDQDEIAFLSHQRAAEPEKPGDFPKNWYRSVSRSGEGKWSQWTLTRAFGPRQHSRSSKPSCRRFRRQEISPLETLARSRMGQPP